MMKHERVRCTWCGEVAAVRIVWGLPDHDPELGHAVAEGRVILGGCLVGPWSMKWHCRACGREWMPLLPNEPQRESEQ